MATVVKTIMPRGAHLCRRLQSKRRSELYRHLEAERGEQRGAPVSRSRERGTENRSPGARIRCVAALKPGEAPASWGYLIDGKESKAKVGGPIMCSILKWKGAALLSRKLAKWRGVQFVPSIPNTCGE